MINKRCSYILVVIFIFSGMMNDLTYAKQLEDEDTPNKF